MFQREVRHRHAADDGDRGQSQAVDIDVDADRAWLVRAMADRAGRTSRQCQ